MKLTADEKRAVKCGDSWEAFGMRLGWRQLSGWTFDDSATFLGDDGSRLQITKEFRLSAEAELDLLEAIRKAT